jgi:outer membrane protein OmpA-like peptidoglycan-associated protein
MTGRFRLASITLASLAYLVAGCDHKPAPTAKPAIAPGVVESERRPADSLSNQASSLTAPSIQVRGLKFSGPCPDTGHAEESQAGSDTGPIPLKVGLTIASIWHGHAEDYDHECLTQVTSADATTVTVTLSCPAGTDRKPVGWTRRLCREDLRNSPILYTQFSQSLEVIIGATGLALSSQSFAELKDKGSTLHRYVQVDTWDQPTRHFKVTADVEGPLKLMPANAHSPYRADLPDHLDLLVNGRTRSLPIINAEGELKSSNDHRQVIAQILDEPAFPLLLFYQQVEDQYKITYTKIDFPGELEQQLDTEKHADVYGIYFDFGSDRLRPESESVLKEIAAVLTRQPQWKLTMSGHTDNVGGDAFNLELSKKRSEAVRQALHDRYRIDPARLQTTGYGASKPKETNDTPEGRARNRRVELVRTN